MHRRHRRRVHRLDERGNRTSNSRAKGHGFHLYHKFSPDHTPINAGSVYSNLEEIRKRVSSEHPDVVLIQETQQLPAGTTVKISGYSLLNRARKTPRNGENIRGGGVAILVTSSRSDLIFWELERPQLDPDVTTEIVADRVYLNPVAGKRSLDIVNIYIPPIHAGSDDHHQQFFSADRTLFPFLKGVQSEDDSLGLIVAGDINAHALEWDIYSLEDRIGTDIVDFLVNDFSNYELF